MKRTTQILVLLMLAAQLPAQKQVIERVDPPSWFTGMKDNALQLMVYGMEIGSYDVKTDYPGVEVKTLVRTENPNYLFVNLNISDEAAPGTVTLTFTSGRKKLTHTYPLLARPAGAARGLNSSDVIYLLMPDRFAPVRQRRYNQRQCRRHDRTIKPQQPRRSARRRPEGNHESP